MMLPERYKKWLRVPLDRIVAPSRDGQIDLPSIRSGILFVIADWSGASQMSFRTLNEVLAELPDLYGDLLVYIVDTDAPATEEFMVRCGDVPAGRGETYWIRDGGLIGSLPSCTGGEKDTIRALTKEVLTGG